MKKVFKILGIIVLVLIFLVLIYYFIIHFDGFLNKDNKLSREEVIELLEKGKEYPNYYYCSQSSWIFGKIDEQKTEIYVKDNMESCLVEGEIVIWKNYNTKEYISIIGEIKGKKYAGINSLDNIETNEDAQNGFDYSLISKEEAFNTEFKYLGEKVIDDRETIIVKVWNKNWFEVDCTKFYIDKETGLIMRRIDYNTLGFVKMDCDRNVKLDIVTDQDVQRPDLDGYERLQ